MLTIFRKFSTFYKYTHEKLVVTCKDIADLSSDKLISYFGKKEAMHKFFETIPQKAKSMQTSEINEICVYLSKFPNINQLSPALWQGISNELCKRSSEMEIDEIISIIDTFSRIKAEPKLIKELYMSMCKELEEFEYAEFLAQPFHKLEQLLANYSLKNLGTGILYQILSETLMYKPDFNDIAYQHLARLSYYFSRAHMAKRKSAKFLKKTEEVL